MAFDTDKFRSANFTRRTANVPVPELAGFFAPGEDAVFVVRNLDATEYGRVNSEVQTNRGETLRQIIIAAGKGDVKALLESVKDYLTDEQNRLPDDTVERLYLIEYGTVLPNLSHDDVLRLMKNAEVFYRLSRKIKELTGLGPEMGE